MPELTFKLTPSSDNELTCFFCGKAGIDHEFSYRSDDPHGARRHHGIGVHLACATSRTYRVDEDCPSTTPPVKVVLHYEDEQLAMYPIEDE
jgi:hypothetical protein